jgi:hypothetical protein
LRDWSSTYCYEEEICAMGRTVFKGDGDGIAINLRSRETNSYLELDTSFTECALELLARTLIFESDEARECFDDRYL